MAANSLICPFTKHVTCEQPATGGGGWPARPDPAIFKKSLSLPRWRFFFYIIFSQPTPVPPSVRGRRGSKQGSPPVRASGSGDQEGTCGVPGRGQGSAGGAPAPLPELSPSPGDPGAVPAPVSLPSRSGGGRRWQLTDGWMLSSPAPPRSPHPAGVAPASFPPWASAFRHPSAPARLSKDVCEGVLLPVLAWEAQRGQDHPPHPSPAVSLPL